MSEFKITGNLYVSEWNGSPSNPGTATSPFKHPSSAPNSTTNIVVVGAGVYKGGWTTGNRVLRGDGKVIIDMQGGNIGAGGSTNLDYSSDNIEIRNCNIFSMSSGSTGMHSNFIISVNTLNSIRLRFRNTVSLLTLTNLSYAPESFANYGSFYFSILLGGIIGNGIPFSEYNYVPKGKKVKAMNPTDSTNHVNNMYNGIIEVGGMDYELKKLIDGTARPDADPLIPDLATVWSDCYTNGNYAGDPKFVDILNRIVEPDSDLLKKSGTYGYVGGVRPGRSIPVSSSDSSITITSNDIDTSNPNNWVIQSPATEGEIDIIWKISDNITEVQRIFLDALLNFDGSQAGGSIGNNNVPDIFPTSYSSLSAGGLKPNRLIYKLRTSQSISRPVVDSQWDNDSVALGTNPGDFYYQEWNTKPTISTVLGVAYGNGNPQSIGSTPNGINARYAHAKIRLTDNRSY